MAIKITIIEPDEEKLKSLVSEALQATAGVPKVLTLEEITDEKIIAKFELPETPAVVVNGEVKASGKFLDKKEFRKLFMDSLKASS